MVVLLPLTLTGCGRSGDVSGQVSFEGVPLTGGWVTLNYLEGKHPPVSGVIASDGSYRISGCPTGDVRVTVRLNRGNGKTPSQSQTLVLARYADSEKTDLTAQIGGGSQRLDLDLRR
jgi:hypothetical protein